MWNVSCCDCFQYSVKLFRVPGPLCNAWFNVPVSHYAGHLVFVFGRVWDRFNGLEMKSSAFLLDCSITPLETLVSENKFYFKKGFVIHISGRFPIERMLMEFSCCVVIFFPRHPERSESFLCRSDRTQGSLPLQ